MPEYEGRFEMIDKDETVQIPDEAIGVTTDSFGEQWTVYYLVPEGFDDAAE